MNDQVLGYFLGLRAFRYTNTGLEAVDTEISPGPDPAVHSGQRLLDFRYPPINLTVLQSDTVGYNDFCWASGLKRRSLLGLPRVV